MEKPEARSRRRADLDRMKARARRFYPEAPCPERLANNLKATSSCRCCGNPRRMEKGVERLTVQERRAPQE